MKIGAVRHLFIVLFIAMICIALSGCDEGRRGELRDSCGIKPIMIIYGKDAVRKTFFYSVDERTGVVYINSYYGITAALNKDGTPMLKEQLKEMMQELE